MRYTIERARGSVADLTLAERSTIVDTLAVLGREGDVPQEAAMEIVAVRPTDTGKRPREPTSVLQRNDRLVGRCREGERCADLSLHQMYSIWACECFGRRMVLLSWSDFSRLKHRGTVTLTKSCVHRL